MLLGSAYAKGPAKHDVAGTDADQTDIIKSDKSQKSNPSQKEKKKKSEKKKDSTKKDKSKKDKKSKKAGKKKKEKVSNSDKDSEKETKKVTIKSDDPKAFTKALLYEKQGVEVQIVDSEKKKKNKRKTKPSSKNKDASSSEELDDFFDFSTMLIPITHEARLGSPYGIRDHRLHRGVDIQVEKGEPMVAAYPGKVIVSRFNKGGYGHYVIVEHENGLQTLYGHLAERSVKVGDEVYPGDIVGLAGNTGKSSGAHLHFEIRYGDVNIDPVTVIDFPHWQLKPGVENYSKKKAIQAHRKIQSKLKIENVYIVKKGDTVADVAEFFYISEDAVRRINKLGKDETLRVGQKLKGCN